MKANCFIDLNTLGASKDNPSYAILGKAMLVLHGAFARLSETENLQFAIAFPHYKQGKVRSMGDKIRVFAESSADLCALIDLINKHALFRDYVIISFPKDVPTNFKGEWSIWRRIRVQKKEGLNKMRTIERAQSAIFIEVHSKSNKQFFPLCIFREKSTANFSHKKTNVTKLNTYGLSSNNYLVALPDI